MDMQQSCVDRRAIFPLAYIASIVMGQNESTCTYPEQTNGRKSITHILLVHLIVPFP